MIRPCKTEVKPEIKCLGSLLGILSVILAGMARAAGNLKKRAKDMTVQELMDIVLERLASSGGCHCPHCGRVHPVVIGDYRRIITDFVDGKVVDCVLKTKLVRCPRCGHHSVILNSLVIPYGRHSLRLVLFALADYFSGMKIELICGKYCISAPTIYRWRDKFLEDKALWRKALDKGMADALEFIAMAAGMDEGGGSCAGQEFLGVFIEENAGRLSFMQRHGNAYWHQWP